MLTRLKDAQGAVLARICARPWPAVLIAAVTVAAAVATFAFSRPELLPSVHDGHLVAEVAAPPSTALDVMRGYGAHISEALLRLPGVRSVSQRIGRDVTGDDGWGPEHAVFDIDLAPGLNARAQEAIAQGVRDELKEHPGLTLALASRFDTVQTSLRAAAPVQIGLYGQDLDALDKAADQIGATIRALPGARDVKVEADAQGPVVRIDLNFPRLALYGLSAADVLDTVQAAFAGEPVAQIFVGGRVVDLAVSAQEQLRRDPEGVGDLLLRSTSGVSVPLKTVANVYLTDGRVMIPHEGGLRRQVVTASPADAARFVVLAKKAIADHVALPAGTFLEFGGAGQAAVDAKRNMLVNYALAVLTIVALLSIAFDGRTGALILASSLFSFVGAAVAVLFLGGVLSLGAIVGLIALFGISMRSAILLFDRLEYLVLSHKAAWSPATVVLATRQRLTPVLMTSFLAALALAPLALDAGQAGREILGPMALVILGGLITGLLGDLLVLPAMIVALWRPGYAWRARHAHDHEHGHEHDHDHPHEHS